MNALTARLVLTVVSYALAYYLASFFGIAYGAIFPEFLGGGSFIPTSAVQWLAGLPLAAVFFVVFFQLIVGKRNVWLWVIIASVPAFLFELVIDPWHIYFPIILGLIAWGLGTMAHKTLSKLAPSFMAKIS